MQYVLLDLTVAGQTSLAEMQSVPFNVSAWNVLRVNEPTVTYEKNIMRYILDLYKLVHLGNRGPPR